jgi:transcription elongation factor Elf1
MLTVHPLPPCSHSSPDPAPIARGDVADSALRKGLVCPACGSRRLAVAYTRAGAGGTIRRRRDCGDCGARFTTREATVPMLIAAQP